MIIIIISSSSSRSISIVIIVTIMIISITTITIIMISWLCLFAWNLFICSERQAEWCLSRHGVSGTPDLPTKIIPTKIRWPKMSCKIPMNMRIPPLRLRLCLSQTLWKSRI